MKLALFGATGGTGQHVARKALAGGHSVIALVRRPDALDITHPSLEKIKGDVLDAASVARAIGGVDAVMVSLGVGGLWSGRARTTMLSQGATNIVTAMRATAVRRLVAISSVGVVDDPTEELIYRYVIKKILRNLYTDMARMEEVVRHSDLDWTVLRPPMLTDWVERYRVRICRGGNVPFGYRLSRADCAAFVLACATHNLYPREIIGISYPTRRTGSIGELVDTTTLSVATSKDLI
jgi:uncharacterized protein YbjT (DUF2867 family)